MARQDRLLAFDEDCSLLSHGHNHARDIMAPHEIARHLYDGLSGNQALPDKVPQLIGIRLDQPGPSAESLPKSFATGVQYDFLARQRLDHLP